jgi:hypothetical protein
MYEVTQNRLDVTLLAGLSLRKSGSIREFGFVAFFWV